MKCSKNTEKYDKKVLRRWNGYARSLRLSGLHQRDGFQVAKQDNKSCFAISMSCKNWHRNDKANRILMALMKCLEDETGCYTIFYEDLFVQNGVEKYMDSHPIHVLLNLQVVPSSDDQKLSLTWEENNNTKGMDFVPKAIRYTFEWKYADQKLMNSVVETESSDVMAQIAHNKQIAYVCLSIDEQWLEKITKVDRFKLYDTLKKCLELFSHIDWNAENIRAYKLYQSNKHKPQDKVELFPSSCSEKNFEQGDLLNICTYGHEAEKVRFYLFDKTDSEKMAESVGNDERDAFIFLTNRLIENLFGREWIEKSEDKPKLKGAPVIVYESKREVYPIGLPKASQIDGVFFSSELYNEKRKEAELYDYVVFNRYTDSKFYVEFEKANYEDHGRVKDAEGKAAKKVMIPRYYKRLLGYLDFPMKMIRKEEYINIYKKLNLEEKEAFDSCYEEIKGEIFYKLKNEYVSDENGVAESDSDPEKSKLKSKVSNIQKDLGLYKNVEILKIPKEVRKKESLLHRVKHRWDKFKIKVLKAAIGKSEYLLKTEWTSETDDRNNIARLNPNMMSLLGVSEEDKILVKFGKRQEVLRVLTDSKLTDYQIGIPAPARKRMGMNSINDIVVVHRDMIHIFWRHSEDQTMAILGTILAVYQVVGQVWLGIALSFIIAPLTMYFVLNKERVKVK